jgi:hypothetical protein
MALSFGSATGYPSKSPFSSRVIAANSVDEDMLLRMNGHFMQGQKQDLMPHGQGEYHFRNGTSYLGNFKQGM